MIARPRWTVGIAGLVVSAIAILAADFVAPYDPAEQFRDHPLEAPNIQGPIRFLVRGSEYSVGGLFRANVHLFGAAEPRHAFLMGTDSFGRDQFSRFLQATRVSIAAALLAAGVMLALGGLLGAVAGYFGGFADDVVMRAGEAFLSLPWMYLVLAARAFLPLDFPASASFATVVLVPGILGWARMARVIRGAVLPLRDRGYVVAARAFGGSHAYVIRRHLLPEVWPLALTQATIVLPRFVAAEVTLSFLGLGIDEPLASWGNMLGGVQQYHSMVAHSWLLLPVLGPVLFSLCCFLLSDRALAQRSNVAG